MRPLLLLLLLLTACASPALGPPVPLGTTLGGDLLPATEAAAKAHEIPIGWFSALRAGAMEPMDEACFVLELRNGDERQQWLLRLQALSLEGRATKTTMTLHALDGREFVLESGSSLIAVAVFGPFSEADSNESKSAVDIVHVPTAFLKEGIERACEVGRRQRLSGMALDQLRHVSDADLRTYCGGVAALLSFLQIVQENKVLNAVLWQVLEKPSPLSVLLKGFSISLAIEPHFDAIETMQDPMRGVESGSRLPIDMRINGTPALRLELLAVRPDPPLQISGGIIAMQARHPAHTERRFSAWLISARLARRP